jgi:RNA polymerase sigma factor (sigma-70 family)
MSANPEQLAEIVIAARSGDLQAFARLIELTQGMAYALAMGVLRKPADAEDVVQDAYVRAFKRLPELVDPSAFAGWLRRIVVATSLNQRRRSRTVWLPATEPSLPPVLDDEERTWNDDQQRRLARALLTLSAPERRLCELHYHGGWSAERLARDAQVEAATMRKRLQRIRDKLREEIEMDEHQILQTFPTSRQLPLKIAELLAQPRLVDIPENPVAVVATLLRSAFPGYSETQLPEELDLAVARERLGGDAVYVDHSKLQRIEGERVLRYDLTLPLLLNVRWSGAPLRLTASGKAYRQETVSPTHLEAFHQLELFAVDTRASLDTWTFAGRILDAVDRVLPRAEVRVTPTDYPMCRRAWSLDVQRAGEWIEVLAWGEYADWVVRGIGADPELHTALGAGVGLERLAALKYSIDDIRKMASTSLG